eukprot:11900719-Ditylum_brightwellii.AAC.1
MDLTFGYQQSWALFDVDYDDISVNYLPPPTPVPTPLPTLAPTTAPFAFTSGCINGDGTFSQGTLS